MLTGATDTVSMVIRNIVRQLETPDRLRGRMMGVNMVFFMGGPQLGELEAGAVANWLGAPFSVISGGIGCLLATGWVAARRRRCGATGAERREHGENRTAVNNGGTAERWRAVALTASRYRPRPARFRSLLIPLPPYLRYLRRRSTTRKYGSAIADSAAATPKADAKP